MREKFYALVPVVLSVSLWPSQIKVCAPVEDNRVVKSSSKDLEPIRTISMNDVFVVNTYQKFEHARLDHQQTAQFLEVFLIAQETKVLVLMRLCYGRQIAVDCEEFFSHAALCSAKAPYGVKTMADYGKHENVIVDTKTKKSVGSAARCRAQAPGGA